MRRAIFDQTGVEVSGKGPVEGRLHVTRMAASWCRRGLVMLALGVVVVLLSGRSAVAQEAGISIDTEGIVRSETFRRESSQQSRKRKQAFAEANLPGQLANPSELRKISLRGLTEAMQAAGSPSRLPESARYLYGLQRLDYVFVDEERRDIILAGPAEGFAPDEAGRMVGITTGRPVMSLEDLLAAMRWTGRGGRRDKISCSIDPEPQRLQNLQNWLRQNSSATSRSAAQSRYGVMAKILGYQEISINGVPADSHFARVMVEADYRMKLIAIGKEGSGVPGIKSQLSMLAPNGNSLQRWWFVPFYDPIEVDDAKLSFRLSGQRVQLLAQDEWSDASGNRSDAAFTRRSTERFAQQFKEHFPAMAEKSPVFAELQNVFDLAVLAALLDQEGLAQRVGLPMDLLLDGEQWPLEQHPVPRQVHSLATTTNRGNFVLGLVGGVTLVPSQVLAQTRRTEADSELRTMRSSALIRGTPPSAPQSLPGAQQPSASERGAAQQSASESGTEATGANRGTPFVASAWWDGP